MRANERMQTAAIALILPFLGSLAIAQIEIFRVLGADNAAPIEAPNLDLFALFFCVSALPIILLSLGAAPWIRWLAFVFAALFVVAHTAHAVEHAMAQDWIAVSLMALICICAQSHRCNAFVARPHFKSHAGSQAVTGPTLPIGRSCNMRARKPPRGRRVE